MEKCVKKAYRTESGSLSARESIIYIFFMEKKRLLKRKYLWPHVDLNLAKLVAKAQTEAPIDMSGSQKSKILISGTKYCILKKTLDGKVVSRRGLVNYRNLTQFEVLPLLSRRLHLVLKAQVTQNSTM
ncbi:unnamed protein product [Ceratitis capitata]|uniref:(Mediterranean fruit fly) hypothetical protein n=1 Tax=Ceratitis capitata TaxID=7213 RepID=A0A811VG52_CERCA|nr:unnamed protein product [Ceratitis capitata]